MQKGKLKLKLYGRIMATVILLSFWRSPVFGEPLMEPPLSLSESGTRRYSDLEVITLIDEISEAALAAIEQAAAESAKASALAAIEREAAAIREAAHQQAEALRWRLEAETHSKAVSTAKRAGVRNAIITGVICFLGGFAIGVGGVILMSR